MVKFLIGMKYTPAQYAKALYDILEENPKEKSQTLSLFAKHLVKNGDAQKLRAIVTAFEREWRERKDIVAVEVTAAEKAVFSKKELEKIIGKEVELKEKVDPSVGAGARIRVGDHQIDNTLARRLSDLRVALTR